MDTVKTGKFLSELRHEMGLTQEQLGEKIGVTNKTVSRWETGTYMPPIESLEALSNVLGVSINEIIAGERLTPEEYVKKAEENIVNAWHDSSFTLKERQEYFKKKWNKEHISLVVVIIVIMIMLYILNYLWISIPPVPIFFAGLAAVVLYNNAKMAYVERKTFDKHKNDDEHEKK